MLTGMLRRKVNGGKEGRPRTNCSFPSQFASAAQLSAELETALPTVRRIHVRREWICSGSLPFNQITAIRWSDPFVSSWLAASRLREQHSTARLLNNNLLREPCPHHVVSRMQISRYICTYCLHAWNMAMHMEIINKTPHETPHQ